MVIPEFDHSLYTGSRLSKYCELCGSQLLGNPLGDEWCSKVDCDYIHFADEAEEEGHDGS